MAKLSRSAIARLLSDEIEVKHFLGRDCLCQQSAALGSPPPTLRTDTRNWSHRSPICIAVIVACIVVTDMTLRLEYSTARPAPASKMCWELSSRPTTTTNARRYHVSHHSSFFPIRSRRSFTPNNSAVKLLWLGDRDHHVLLLLLDTRRLPVHIGALGLTAEL